jgi:predicted nucleic acid-binding protein
VILVDSTVWVDHLRHGDALLEDRLNAGAVWTHPFIIGEVALGSLRQRGAILTLLRGLPMAVSASDDEVQTLIEQTPLYSLGIGYIDAHLLAATRLTPHMRLWTRDRRLHTAAQNLGIANQAHGH